MKHLGQNGHQKQKGQFVHFVFEKECQWRAYFGVCKYVQRNGTITTYLDMYLQIPRVKFPKIVPSSDMYLQVPREEALLKIHVLPF